MKIAIHNGKDGFHPYWVKYCIENNISFKLVDCYETNIIQELRDCRALLWHYSNTGGKDKIIAKQILFSLEHAGKTVFPNFSTGWHFDDKLAQKYLLEAIGAPLVPTFVFYDKQKAIQWAENTSYPKVFKLRSGAGSLNVSLIENFSKAKKIIKKGFNRGFSPYNRIESFKWNILRFKNHSGSFKDVLKSFIRLFFFQPQYTKIIGREIGYVYFQDFIPDNPTDYRIKVVKGKCWGFQRQVRENDFRASGSGRIIYDKNQIPQDMIKIAFEVFEKLKLQCVAFDFVRLKDESLIVEMSYGFGIDDKEFENGYWDRNLNWHEGAFNPIDDVIKEIIKRK